MSAPGLFQLAVLLVALAVSIGPLGRYAARVLEPDPVRGAPGDRFFLPVERAVQRVAGVDGRREQRWSAYAGSLLAFSLLSVLALYALARLQGVLPMNPTGRPAMSPWGAFNAAISFTTNTNWQWFSGEQAASHLTQMLGFTVQNFVSAAAGISVAVALVRGLTRHGRTTIGNFWVDLLRVCLRILLPLATIGALVLASQGVVQTLRGTTTVEILDRAASAEGTQDIVVGPFAGQEAIKILGTNGGGPYNANSAHPFENPNGWTNLVQLYSMLVLPFSLTVTYGVLAGSRRQGRALLVVMATLWLAFSFGTVFAEQHGNVAFDTLGVDQSMSAAQTGGNMEGKEVRFGPASCGLFAASTTGTSTGAVNCTHDSLTPTAAVLATLHIMLGEVSPGGVGVGLIGILINALLAVFIAGLMVGRTPEFLGKKVQAAEMKLVVLTVVVVPVALLGLAAATVLRDSAMTAVQTDDARGLAETLYNYASAANNNGSAFAYVDTSSPWYTVTQGIAMFVGRFGVIVPVLALGGSFVGKRRIPETSGTFPTDTPLFSALLGGVVLVIAGLTYFPALSLGPILELLSR